MVRMTDRQCTRCTNHLASSNHSRDRICGACQRELGPKGSAAWRTWITNGRKREIDRAAVPAEIASLDRLSNADLVRLAREASALVERRRAAAEALLRDLGAPAAEPAKS